MSAFGTILRLTVSKNDVVSLFAETAEDAGQIDAARAAQSLEKAKAVIKPGLDPMQLA